MSPTLLLISHQNLTLNLGSWLWKCFFKSNDAFNAETKIIQSFCEIDSESKSWWFVFWLKIKPYSTILFHWKITVSLCGSSKSCRVTVNGNDSLNISRDNDFHILSSKFYWKFLEAVFHNLTFFKFAVLIHCLSREGRFKVESCKLSIFNDVNELVKLKHKECFSFEWWDFNGFSESSNKSDGSVLGSLISLCKKQIKEYSRWVADTTI